jgi:hypothetical protein
LVLRSIDDGESPRAEWKNLDLNPEVQVTQHSVCEPGQVVLSLNFLYSSVNRMPEANSRVVVQE